MALAESREERDATAAVFRKLKGQESALDQRIKTHRPAPSGVDPQRQVAAALGTLDRLSESLAVGDADWAAVGSAFTLTNAKLYLRFTEVEKGRKRFNVPVGGVVTFGSTPPPGPLYTGPTGPSSARCWRLARRSPRPRGALPRGIPTPARA